jgi:hypothetical protein
MSDRFSSKQVVSMVVAICVAIVLAPTTVWAAATASSVKITYAGHAARVDKSGHLKVGDGSGPLTVDGKVSTTVGGKVTTNIADPHTPSHAASVDSTGHLLTVGPQSTIAATANFENVGTTYLTSATTASLAITEAQVAETRLNGTTTGSDLYVQIEQFSASGATCGTTPIRTLFVATLGSGQALDLAPSTPLVVTASGSTPYCVALVSTIDTGGTDATTHYPQYRFTAYVASGSYKGIGTAAQPAKVELSDRKPTTH